MKKILLPAISAIVILSACNLTVGSGIDGNGNIRQQNMPLSGFENIDAGGAFSVRLKQGPFSVMAETDENLLEYIDATVRNNTLLLRTKKPLNPTERLGMIISLPHLKNIDMSGASFVITDGRIQSEDAVSVDFSGASSGQLDISAPELSFDLSGSSKADTRGTSKYVMVDASGSSLFNGMEASYDEMNIDLSGSSNAEVQVSSKLKVSASGASVVTYSGNPTVQSEVSGAANVVKKN